ncbi:MAG TPA: PaaI family thioesterase [Microthrixaceae bacterium]|nr:PaaI family thioesterase [Microthrixaceae bacterium]
MNDDNGADNLPGSDSGSDSDKGSGSDSGGDSGDGGKRSGLGSLMGEAGIPADHSPRVEGLGRLSMTPQRVGARRLADAMRQIIDLLVATTASAEELERAALVAESFVQELQSLPAGLTYRGFAETANSGGEVDGVRAGDQDWFGFFDHSPFIGLANPLSPPMALEYGDNEVYGKVTFGAAYEGPPGCVHGGYIAGVFDELLGSAQSLSGSQGMTAHLGVDYRSPTPLHAELELLGRFERQEGRKIFTRGEIRVGGQITAEAQGLFIRMDPERFSSLLTERNRVD